MKIVGIIALLAAMIGFAIQTWELVDWLFPAENFLMKVITVIVFDGFSAGWASAEVFYPFRRSNNKHLANGMWLIDFFLSMLATVLQMFLSSAFRFKIDVPFAVDLTAYALVTIAFAANIVVLTIIVRGEIMAAARAASIGGGGTPPPRQSAPVPGAPQAPTASAKPATPASGPSRPSVEELERRLALAQKMRAAGVAVDEVFFHTGIRIGSDGDPAPAPAPTPQASGEASTNGPETGPLPIAAGGGAPGADPLAEAPTGRNGAKK